MEQKRFREYGVIPVCGKWSEESLKQDETKQARHTALAFVVLALLRLEGLYGVGYVHVIPFPEVGRQI